jgi:hypothetical protein
VFILFSHPTYTNKLAHTRRHMCRRYPQVETCHEKIFSLELEDPKSLESPVTPTAAAIIESFIMSEQQHHQQQQQQQNDDSDDNHSMITVCPNSTDDTFVLSPTDPDDYINANVLASTQVRTIVEVVNPMLTGDGTATEISVGRPDDLESFNDDDEANDDEYDGVVTFRRELSLNDKMKNVLQELRENEKVRLSLSRSMDEEDNDNAEQEHVQETSETDGPSYEEKTGSIGTVFMVRERLINDFYDHEHVPEADNSQASIDSCQVISNPIVDEFLAQEIRHSQDTMTARKETLTLDLVVNQEEEDEDDDDNTTTENTPTTPTKALPGSAAGAAVGGKKKRRKGKNKTKK